MKYLSDPLGGFRYLRYCNFIIYFDDEFPIDKEDKIMNYLVGVYDLKSETYCGLYAARDVYEAKQAFLNIVKDEKNFISQYPADFQMVQLGTISNEGVFTSNRLVLVYGSDFKPVEKEN